MAGLAEGDSLISLVLASGEWKEETKASGKKWYWRKHDKKRAKNREELLAILQDEATAAPAAPPPPPPGQAGGEGAPIGMAQDGQGDALGAVPAVPPGMADPDQRDMEKMGLLGSDADGLDDVQELRNHVKMWEEKYKVLLEENRRLLAVTSGGADPAFGRAGGCVGTIVPSDLQLKYDALQRSNSALLAELDLKKGDVEQLTAAVAELSDMKSKLEVQLAEAYTQAQSTHEELLKEGQEAKQRLAEKDEMMQRAETFVNKHYAEQNRFLASQVAELTGLLHKIKEDDGWAQRLRVAEEASADLPAMPPEERANVAQHFAALLNSSARHVLSPRTQAALSRMVSSERGQLDMVGLHALPPEPHYDGADPSAGDQNRTHQESIRQHYARQHVLPRPRPQIAAAGDPVLPLPATQVALPEPVRAPPAAGLGAGGPSHAIANFEGYIVRARHR